MKKFKINLGRRFWFNKVIRNVVEFSIHTDLNGVKQGELLQNRNAKYLSVLLDDRTRFFINLDKYTYFRLGEDYISFENEIIRKQSQGKAVL